MDIISIIVPVFKGGKYVPLLIKMAENNFLKLDTNKNMGVELVLVNDAPDDKIGCNWKSSIISILCIENIQNEGIHRSRINGLKASHGKYIVFLDQDDYIDDNYLKSQLRYIKNADAVLCNGKERGKVLYSEEAARLLQTISHKTMNGSNIIVSPGQVLLKRQAIPEFWMKHRMNYNGADDFFLWMLMILNKSIFSYNYEVLYIHNVTGVNYSGNYENMQNSVDEMLDLLVQGNFLTQSQIEEIKRSRKMAHAKLIEEQKYLNYKDTQYLHLFDIWLTNVERGIKIESFFLRRDINNVAVYGMGIIGKHFIKELEDTDVHIKGIIDIGKKNKDNGLVKLGNVINNIDAIVVTPFLEFREIKKALSEYYECQIISIEEVIYMSEV